MTQFNIPVVTSAVPAPAADAAPSINDIIGAPADPAVPAADQGVKDLGQYFGVEGVDAAATTAALKPVLEMMAQGGRQAQQQQQAQPPAQPPQNSQQQEAPPLNLDTPVLDMDGIDLGDDVSPEIAKAFKQLGERSQKAIGAATAQAKAAQEAAQQNQYVMYDQQQKQYQNQKQEVTTRAVNYLDGLASPKYGVGENRTLVQTLASEQVMQTAGNLIRGMEVYGKVMPIEQVMGAAIMMAGDPVPATPAALPPGVPALSPSAPTGVAPSPTRGVGSGGAGRSLMNDGEFLDGARAILAR